MDPKEIKKQLETPQPGPVKNNIAQSVSASLRVAGEAWDRGAEAVDKFLGPSGKAWLANGLDEIRSVFIPGAEYVQPGNNPGIFGSITTGEATLDRRNESSTEALHEQERTR